MISIVVCLLQITLIGILALIVHRWTIHRDPSLSARLSLAAILLCGLAMVASFIDLPRVWTIREQLAGQPVQTEITTKLVASDSSKASASIATGYGVNFFLGGLADLRRESPRLERGLISSFSMLGLVIGLLAFTRCLLGSWGLWQLSQNSRQSEDSFLNDELAELAETAGVKQELSLRLNPSVSAPCVSWVSPGSIFVPTNFGTWTKTERVASLAHELSHESRRDARWRFLAELCLAPICFHPVAALLRRQLIFAQELATDYAAMQFMNPKQYRQGLSMLALRMDSQCNRFPSFGVSISTNNLVRRIKMLKNPNRFLLRWQSLLLLTLFTSLGTASVCWTAKADDISTAKRSSTSSDAEAFSGSTSTPWDSLGAQTGYWNLRVADLCEHDEWKTIWDALASNVQGFDVKPHGLTAENVQDLITDVEVGIAFVEPEKRKDPDKVYEGRIFSNAFSLKTVTPIDWPKFGKAMLTTSPLGESPEMEKYLGEALSEAGVAADFSLVSKKSESLKVPLLEELKAAYKLVDGGKLTTCVVVPQEDVAAIEPHLTDEKDPLQLRKLALKTEVLSCGIDLDASNKSHFQVVLLPNAAEDVNEYVASIRGKITSLATMLRNYGDGSGDQELVKFCDAVKSAQVEVVAIGVKNRSAVQISFSTNADTIALAGLDVSEFEASAKTANSEPGATGEVVR